MTRDGRSAYSKPWKKNAAFFQPLEKRRRAEPLAAAAAAARPPPTRRAVLFR